MYYYVYILLSLKDNKFYIGFTSNLKERTKQHKNGKVRSTKNRKPLKLIYFETYINENLARERERKLKQFGSAYVGLMKRLGYK